MYFKHSSNDRKLMLYIYTWILQNRSIASTVNYYLLILEASGFGEPLPSWFKSFLVDRYYYVKVFGVSSLAFSIPSGGT